MIPDTLLLASRLAALPVPLFQLRDYLNPTGTVIHNCQQKDGGFISFPWPEALLCVCVRDVLCILAWRH